MNKISNYADRKMTIKNSARGQAGGHDSVISNDYAEEPEIKLNKRRVIKTTHSRSPHKGGS